MRLRRLIHLGHPRPKVVSGPRGIEVPVNHIHEIEDLIAELVGAYDPISRLVFPKVRDAPAKIELSRHVPSQESARLPADRTARSAMFAEPVSPVRSTDRHRENPYRLCVLA